MEQKNNFDIKSIKVYRNTEAKIFEIVFAILAIIVWGIIICLVLKAPDTIPIHFDASGNPNDYGPAAGIMIPCVIITLVAIGIMITAYHPQHINMPYKITNIRQVECAIRSIRVAGIILLITCLAIAYTLLGMESPNATPVLATVILLIVEMIVFSILGYRAK